MLVIPPKNGAMLEGPGSLCRTISFPEVKVKARTEEGVKLAFGSFQRSRAPIARRPTKSRMQQQHIIHVLCVYVCMHACMYRWIDR